MNAVAASRVERGIAEICAAVEELPDRDALRVLLPAIERLRAVSCKRVQRVDAACGYAEDGSTSMVAWLISQCHMAPSDAGQLVHVSQQLPALPAVEAALSGGSINLRHAAVVADTVKAIGPEHEDLLVVAAQRSDPQKLAREAHKVRQQVDPEATERAARQAFEAREFHIRERSPLRWSFGGEGEAPGMATLLKALDAVMGRPSKSDPRTPAQRRYDGLIAMAQLLLDGGGLGKRGAVRPNLTVVVPLAALEGKDVAEFPGIGPVSGATLQRIACDAELCVVTVDERNQPWSVSRTQRTHSPKKTRAVLARDQGCVWPDCGARADWCYSHHYKLQKKDGGPDGPRTECLICHPHHVMVHEGGWILLQCDDGGWMVIPPDRGLP